MLELNAEGLHQEWYKSKRTAADVAVGSVVCFSILNHFKISVVFQAMFSFPQLPQFTENEKATSVFCSNAQYLHVRGWQVG